MIKKTILYIPLVMYASFAFAATPNKPTSTGAQSATATRYIRDEIEWTEPIRKYSCKYNQKHSRGCTEANCPRALGGADYRYIFGISCPFRKPPRTR